MFAPCNRYPKVVTIFAAATLGNKHVNDKLGRPADIHAKITDAIAKQFYDAKWVTSPLLHYRKPNIQHRFLFIWRERVEAKERKLLSLLSSRLTSKHTEQAAAQAAGGNLAIAPHILAATGKEARATRARLVHETGKPLGGPASLNKHGQKILIFFNDIKTLEAVSTVLGKKGYVHGAVHQTMGDQERLETLANFHRGFLRLLLTTDQLARGIDFVKVNCIIEYPLPFSTPSDPTPSYLPLLCVEYWNASLCSSSPSRK